MTFVECNPDDQPFLILRLPYLRNYKPQRSTRNHIPAALPSLQSVSCVRMNYPLNSLCHFDVVLLYSLLFANVCNVSSTAVTAGQHLQSCRLLIAKLSVQEPDPDNDTKSTATIVQRHMQPPILSRIRNAGSVV